MAYERLSQSRSTGEGLDVFVQNTIQLYGRQVKIRNADEEANFFKAVIDNNLSLDDQLEYRKAQFDRVSDDKEERNRLRQEIKDLQSRIKYEKFSNTFLEKVAEVNDGVSSLDSIINWLEDQKEGENNPDILRSINTQIANKKGERFQQIQNLLTSQTNYALKDKSEDIVTAQIARVQKAKTEALLSGDETLAESYDPALDALNKALQENAVKKDLKTFAVQTIVGASSATHLLDSYNNKIATADVSQPITINGVTYASAQEYWRYTRDSYLADSSPSGFFQRLNDEVSTNLKVKNSKNILSSSDVTEAATKFNTLYGRPELQGMTSRIDASKQDAMQVGADLLSNKVVNKYNATLDLNKAMSELNTLKSVGVNIDKALGDIIVSATNLKSQNVSDIVSTAQSLMASQPGLSPSEAVSQAIKMGAGTVLSPNELLTKTPADLAKGIATSVENQSNTQDPRLTVTPPNSGILPGNTPTAPQTPTSTSPASTTGSYTIKSGDTLSAIAAKYGTTVAQLTSLNSIADPNKIYAGQTLKLPSQPAPTNPAPAPIQTNPTPTTPTPTPVAPAPATPTSQPATPAPITQPTNTYTIQRGDTLSAIAMKNNTTVTKLAQLNGIPDPNKIQAGQTIKLY